MCLVLKEALIPRIAAMAAMEQSEEQPPMTPEGRASPAGSVSSVAFFRVLHLSDSVIDLDSQQAQRVGNHRGGDDDFHDS